MFNNMILKTSKKYLGLKEKPGIDSHPTIAEWYKLCKLDGSDDSKVPWCAVYMNGILNECKILGTGSGLARSFLKWGISSKGFEEAGDIVVLERGSQSWQGHVGILIKYSESGKTILVRGGNQNNSVSEEWFSAEKIIDFRRYEGEVEV